MERCGGMIGGERVGKRVELHGGKPALVCGEGKGD